MSFYTVGAFGGPVVGPITGAWVAQQLGWRWIFWVLTIFTGVSAVLGAPFPAVETSSYASEVLILRPHQAASFPRALLQRFSSNKRPRSPERPGGSTFQHSRRQQQAPSPSMSRSRSSDHLRCSSENPSFSSSRSIRHTFVRLLLPLSPCFVALTFIACALQMDCSTAAFLPSPGSITTSADGLQASPVFRSSPSASASSQAFSPTTSSTGLTSKLFERPLASFRPRHGSHFASWAGSLFLSASWYLLGRHSLRSTGS